MTESSLISLRGLELIIAYRGADQERRDNLRGVLRHLHRTYSDYQIWLIEADAAPTFAWSELADPKIRHLFVHDTGPFSKASLVNLGALMTKSPIICMHDADMIANPPYMKFSVDALMDRDASDALCPFMRVLNVSGNRRDSFIQSGDYSEFAPLLEGDLPDEMNLSTPTHRAQSISSDASISYASAGSIHVSSVGGARTTICSFAPRVSACAGMRLRVCPRPCFI